MTNDKKLAFGVCTYSISVRFNLISLQINWISVPINSIKVLNHWNMITARLTQLNSILIE